MQDTARPSIFYRVPPRVVLLCLLCLAMIIRGRFMLSMADSLAADPESYREEARDIVGGTWRQSYYDPWTPNAYRSLLYPLVLAVFESLPRGEGFGTGPLQVLLGVGTVWAVWRLGRIWKLPSGAALVAAALVVADPILLNQSIQVRSGTLAAFLVAVSLLALARCLATGSIAWASLSGALLGFCVLSCPELLLWLVSLLPFLAFFKVRWKRRVAIVISFSLAAFVVLAPGALRNQIKFGSPITTTSRGGYALLLSNNPEYYNHLLTAPRSSVWDNREFQQQWSREVGAMPSSSEMAVDRIDRNHAWQNIRNEPEIFAYASLRHAAEMWQWLPRKGNSDESIASRWLRYSIAMWYTVELLLAAAGVWLLRRQLFAPPWVWCLLLLLSFTAMHIFYSTEMWMRAPLASVVALVAAKTIAVAVERRQLINSLLSADSQSISATT